VLLALPSIVLAQNPQASPPAFAVTVDVIATTPLPGGGLSLAQIPSPVQTALARDLEASGALDLSDFLNRRLNGVHINETQGNPFQPDVNYRGYTASPLLGTPQGLSIYMDGVRLNQPFGDVVSWDLIPRMAISTTTLMPGSNPLFGLNTLGGALSIETKDGRTNPGSSVQVVYGSHVRRAIEFEHGGSKASGLHWYVAGQRFAEHGWRADSPSDVGQLLGKVGWHQPRTDLALTAAYANNTLIGNGLQEQRLLDRDYASIYTKPDPTDNRSTFLNLTTRRSLSPATTLSGNAYYRRLRTSTLNGDLNETSLDQSVYQPSAAERAALTAAGYSGFPTSGATAANTPFPFWRCLGNVLLNDEPAEKCNGLINRTESRQHNAGLSAELTTIRTSATRSNRLTVGAGYDHSSVEFQQSTELGYLNPDRSVTGLNAFADGVSGGNINGDPFDTRVDLDGGINTWSLLATDTLSIGSAWHVTVSGRYNQTRVHNVDGLRPGGQVGSLDGEHTFRRLNPAAGLTFNPSPAITAYVGYSEGSRAATSVELGCADPRLPCKLPNALAGDPTLNQVVAGTWESGVRGRLGNETQWTVGLFRAVNHDDILFVASTQNGFGYFKNFGETKRQGIELSMSRRVKMMTLGAEYTYLDATYQSAETVNGTSNSANDAARDGAKGLDGAIAVAEGDRIPLIPRHMLKASADLDVTSALSLDVNLVAVSRSFARGNENNQHQPDGVYYLGPGESAGYAIVNLSARYHLTRAVDVFAQLNNVFDDHYATAAQLKPVGIRENGTFLARPLPAINGVFPIQQSTFYAPGAPRTFTVGSRVHF
jgi:outer membrane receptor protein involved in Fe transport